MLKRQRHGVVEVFTLDRPEARNAISRALAEELLAALRDGGANPDTRAIVLTASGHDVFAAGGDIKELASFGSSGAGADKVVDLGVALGAIERSPVPVIAALQGAAYGGGCELLLMCDLIIAEAHASMHFVHGRMGLVPAWGGTTRLAERVGSTRAAEVLLTGKALDAATAANLGLVNRVVARGEAAGAALELGQQIANNASRAAVANLKRSLMAARSAHRGDALSREREVFRDAWGSDSHLAAVRTFLDR